MHKIRSLSPILVIFMSFFSSTQIPNYPFLDQYYDDDDSEINKWVPQFISKPMQNSKRFPLDCDVCDRSYSAWIFKGVSNAPVPIDRDWICPLCQCPDSELDLPENNTNNNSEYLKLLSLSSSRPKRQTKSRSSFLLDKPLSSSSSSSSRRSRGVVVPQECDFHFQCCSPECSQWVSFNLINGSSISSSNFTFSTWKVTWFTCPSCQSNWTPPLQDDEQVEIDYSQPTTFSRNVFDLKRSKTPRSTRNSLRSILFADTSIQNSPSNSKSPNGSPFRMPTLGRITRTADPSLLLKDPLSINLPYFHKNIYIDSFGTIDLRPGWHHRLYIWPIGFTSRTRFKTRWYRSEIIDVDGLPSFKVNEIPKSQVPEIFPESDNDTFVSNPQVSIDPTCSQAWLTILKRYPHGKKPSISGPRQFGFSLPQIKCLIEYLPDAKKCIGYEFKFNNG